MGIKRLVAAGSCLEYGHGAQGWEQIPPHAPLDPTTPYGASKAAGFLMLKAATENLGIEFYYGRIFSAYGEGQFKDNLWPSLREAALNRSDFPMTKGDQIRDFISVSEVAQYLAIAIERNDTDKNTPLIVNIGSGKGLSVLEFSQQQWTNFEATGSLIPGKIPSRHNQINRLVADIVGLVPETQAK